MSETGNNEKHLLHVCRSLHYLTSHLPCESCLYCMVHMEIEKICDDSLDTLVGRLNLGKIMSHMGLQLLRWSYCSLFFLSNRGRFFLMGGFFSADC